MLLICAAIGVATGLISSIAGYLSVPTIAFAPVVYGLVLTMHSLPGIVAQEVLRAPWVALLTHVFAALVATAVSWQWVMSYVLAVVLMGGVQEGMAALGRYRRWGTGRFVLTGVVLGLVLGFTAALAISLKYLTPLNGVIAVVLTVVGGAAWALIGLGIGRALRRAGLGRGGA